jgi:hypothetical protein
MRHMRCSCVDGFFVPLTAYLAYTDALKGKMSLEAFGITVFSLCVCVTFEEMTEF